MTKEYRDNLEAGNQFQDYATEALALCGLRISVYTSQAAQLSGENMAGIEIKYDSKFRETGNLYIEYAEKSNPYNYEYVNSGILRDDNTWLYLIGDYNGACMLPKKSLQRLLESVLRGEENIELKETPTSRGMVLPIKKLGKYQLDIKFYNWRPYKEDLLRRLNICEQSK